MENTQFVDVKQTIILYTYRYIWKTKDGKLCIKFLTEPQEGHMKFQTTINDDENIISCVREYVNEINFEYLGFTEPVKKQEEKETKNDDGRD